MQAVSAQPSQSLLQRTDQTDNHNTRKQQDATQSVFASYAFGPLDLHNSSGNDSKRDSNPVSGVGLGKNPLSAASLSFVTSVQEASSSSDTSSKSS